MKQVVGICLLALVLTVFSAPAKAETIFFDDFNGDALGSNGTSKNPLKKWTITAGEVVVQGKNANGQTSSDKLAGAGLGQYIRLGYNYKASTMNSAQPLNLLAGSYTLSFTAASYGSYNDYGSLTTGLNANGQIFSFTDQIVTENNPATASIVNLAHSFTLASGVSNAYLFISDLLGDGTIRIDNVTLSYTAAATPIPASLLLLAPGLAGLAALRRGQRQAG